MRTMQVAIDGPAGVGKSTVARAVASTLYLPLLNSGQLYRAVAYLVTAIKHHDPRDADFCASVARKLDPMIEDGDVVVASGRLTKGKLTSPDISMAASIVSVHAGVREALLLFQQIYAERHGTVMEGRDIGTVVLPQAPCKFYLTCDFEERRRRREADENNESVAAMIQPDAQDGVRPIAPLEMAPDAIAIDTTYLTIDAVAALIVCQVRRTADRLGIHMGD